MDDRTAWTVELPRVVARVAGDAPLAFLHATTTQDLEALQPGHGALTCVLDAKGRVKAEIRVLALEDGSALVDAETAARDVLLEDLARVAPLSGCEIVEEPFRVVAVRGSATNDRPEHSFIRRDGSFVVCVSWGGHGDDVIGADPAVDVQPAPMERYEQERIMRGRPRFGIDITPEMLVNETPLLGRAVSFSKGCYPGQESVARVHNLGRIRRCIAALEGNALRPEARVMAGPEDVGAITSAFGRAGIGYLRVEALERELTVGGEPVIARAL